MKRQIPRLKCLARRLPPSHHTDYPWSLLHQCTDHNLSALECDTNYQLLNNFIITLSVDLSIFLLLLFLHYTKQKLNFKYKA